MEPAVRGEELRLPVLPILLPMEIPLKILAGPCFPQQEVLMRFIVQVQPLMLQPIII